MMAASVAWRATNGRPYGFLVTFVGEEHEGGTPAVGEFPAPTKACIVGAALMPPSSNTLHVSGRILRCAQDDMRKDVRVCFTLGSRGRSPWLGKG